jgi:hypothetical protein
MTLDAEGIRDGWVLDEQGLPTGRVMGETVITPDQKVLILNGARTGIGGYDNVPDRVGASNADNPTYQGVIYDPSQPNGQRISTKMPTSTIARYVHCLSCDCRLNQIQHVSLLQHLTGASSPYSLSHH